MTQYPVPFHESHQEVATPRIFVSERGVSIDALIAAWLHEKTKNSEKTKTAYANTLNEFRVLLQSAGYDLIWKGDDFISTIADSAQAFMMTRSEKSTHQGQVTPATQAQRLAILSSFYLYAIKRQHIKTGNPIDAVDRPQVAAYGEAKPLEQTDVEARLRNIDKDTLAGKRDIALLTVLLTTGRRVKEIMVLTCKDIEESGEHLKVSFERTKGGDSMRDTLSVPVSSALRRWLEVFYQQPLKRIDKNMPVWVNLYHKSHYGNQLGYHGISNICKTYLGDSKVHVTRHTFAILMELAGAKLTDIQQRLGHKNAATTSIYLQRLSKDKNVYAEKLAEMLGISEEE